jgi:hypothetical protein
LFKEKIKLIEIYTTNVMKNCVALIENNVKTGFIDKVFSLIVSWIKFGINIFKNPELSESVLKLMNDSNMKLISSIFAESCSKSDFARIYEDQEKYDLPSVIQLIDKDVLMSIQKTICMINSSISSLYNEKNGFQNYNIINHLSIIFSFILENFIFILFMKNQTSEISLLLLFNLSTMKIKKISQKLFEVFREMRDFINKVIK